MDLITKNLAARYDAAAKGWNGKITPLGYPAAYAELAEKLGMVDAAALDILDAGAGSASFSGAFIAVHGPPKSLTLRDISADMLRVAQRSLQETGIEAHCVSGDIESLPAAPVFDLVLCAHVIEHCPSPTAALKALRGALRPNGKLLLVVSKPHWCTALIRLIWRSRAFHPEKVHALLAASGFDNVENVAFASGPPSRTSMGYIAALQEGNHDNCDC